MLQALYKHWPKTRGHVAFTSVGTPLSNDFYLGSVRGEVYGLDGCNDRYSSLEALLAQHPQTPIKGLYLTGQDSLSVGVVTALFAGLFTACRISYMSALRCVLGMVID